MHKGEVRSNISCDVVNCAYNDDRYHCTAPSIEVGSQNVTSCTANSSSETQCATFRPKMPYKSGYQAL